MINASQIKEYMEVKGMDHEIDCRGDRADVALASARNHAAKLSCASLTGAAGRATCLVASRSA